MSYGSVHCLRVPILWGVFKGTEKGKPSLGGGGGVPNERHTHIGDSTRVLCANITPADDHLMFALKLSAETPPQFVWS